MEQHLALPLWDQTSGTESRQLVTARVSDQDHLLSGAVFSHEQKDSGKSALGGTRRYRSPREGCGMRLSPP